MKFTKEIKAGIIAVVSIIGFVLMYQFSKGESLFASENTYYVKYRDVQGLEPTTPVSINGIKVGQIKEIKPISDEDKGFYSVVKFTVKDKFQLSEKSTAEIFKPDIMGKEQIKINIVYGGKLLEDGDFIKGSSEQSIINDISSQVGPVKDKLENVLKTVDSLSTNANKILNEQNRKEIKIILENLNAATQTFDALARNANKIVETNDEEVSRILQNTDKTMTSANSAFVQYERVAAELDVKQLNATIDNLDRTVTNLNATVAAVNNGEGSLGKLIKDEQLYENLEATTNNLNGLILDIKENPSKYVNISVFGKK